MASVKCFKPRPRPPSAKENGRTEWRMAKQTKVKRCWEQKRV